MKLFKGIAGILLMAGMFAGAVTGCNNRGKSSSAAITYSNPLPVAFGDPFILSASDGKYYMYGTGGVEKGFGAYSSDNLVDWHFEGKVYSGAQPGSWTVKNYWAPEVYEIDGRYYMFFSADWKENPTNELENFRIGVAVADQPTGPFIEISDKPLFDPGYPIIDANILQHDGRAYLYYSRCCYKNPVESEVSAWARVQGLFEEIEESWVYGVEISNDFTSVIGEPVLLLQPPSTMDDPQTEWESRSVTSGEVNRRWTEGSFAFEHNGKIYMMYSANFFGGENYAVGYAVADNPLGPFVKAENNPVLEKNIAGGGDVTGTGHNMVVWSKDNKKMYCVYHGRTQKTGDERVVFIDEMKIDGNGVLTVDGTVHIGKRIVENHMRTYPLEEEERIEKVIRACRLCYVGMADEHGRPYVLPMNFGYEPGVVYLHSAQEGHSISILEKNPQVCITFCTDPGLVWQDEEVACSYRMRAESVICYGKVVFEEDYDEKVKALNSIMRQYSDREFSYSVPSVRNVKIWKVPFDEITAKEFGVPSKNAVRYKDRTQF